MKTITASLGYRGINDRGIVDLANSGERVILTRDNDFLRVNLRRRIRYGLIYIAEPVEAFSCKAIRI